MRRFPTAPRLAGTGRRYVEAPRSGRGRRRGRARRQRARRRLRAGRSGVGRGGFEQPC